MRIHYTLGRDNRNGMNMSFNAEVDEHMLKLIDYLATKISGARKSALQIFWDKYPDGVVETIYFDSEAMLKWLAKLPEWAALKLKLSNPLSTKKFRKELNDKYQGLVKKYKIPDGYFMVDAAAYEEIQKREAAKRKKVKTEK